MWPRLMQKLGRNFDLYLVTVHFSLFIDAHIGVLWNIPRMWAPEFMVLAK